MAGSATHIAVADKIYTLLGDGKISNIAGFFNGNLAPDAIHAKIGYQREDKKHTHLTEGISGADFQNSDKLKIYHKRINEFIEKYYFISGKEKDLYLGYIVHLLTDELFNITVRERFVEGMASDGIEQSEREFFNRIISDIESVDCILTYRYPYFNNPVDILESVWNYEIKDYIGRDEINRSKRWVIDSFFKMKHEPQTPKYYSYEAAVDFINYAAVNIINHLSGDDDINQII